ncbi:TetR/AcrR family transcriptional regulator, partial [Micromonospora aurantiaca]|nr:TetR/AcrR family transcriptional regulator [Micromonospora aurantiaca]
MASTTRPRRKVRERREDVRNRVLRAAAEMMADGTPYTEL